MTYTSHGHHIPATTTDDEQGQVDKVRCGGVALCTVCQKDANQLHGIAVPTEFFEDISEYDKDPNRFQKAALLFVVGSRNNHLEDDATPLSVEDLYIVWWSYTLGNYKALISTTIPGDGLYFEVTHDAPKLKTYVDTYVKLANDVFSQEGEDDGDTSGTTHS